MFPKSFLVILLMPLMVECIRGALFRSGRSPGLQKTRGSQAIKMLYSNLFRPDNGPLLRPQISYNNVIDNEQIFSRLRTLLMPFNAE
ncbi:unnamed protein product [Bursaphelenchus xylophilus]|uniref:(pine wood nematode) hypothetical protein n=1 Tax=Bursaphelenchus xylophilus TaxID=6326 RepID=A0A1I7SDD6_BURXY|nr:unnamed protein product [Bursaphelenchus xylophilus]CAG9130619.1 unnamed protein product [Bursaphelenchus xylophilus]